MEAIVRLYFNAKAIGMPFDQSDYPKDVSVDELEKYRKAQNDQQAWRAACWEASSTNDLLKGHVWDKNNGWSFAGEHNVMLGRTFGSQDVLYGDGHVNNPFSKEASAKAKRATICVVVETPPGEGYCRGVHPVSDAFGLVIGRVVVTFDPTEKSGQPRYRIDGEALPHSISRETNVFADLAKIVGEILAGRVPEIVHSHKLPCA